MNFIFSQFWARTYSNCSLSLFLHSSLWNKAFSFFDFQIRRLIYQLIILIPKQCSSGDLKLYYRPFSFWIGNRTYTKWRIWSINQFVVVMYGWNSTISIIVVLILIRGKGKGEVASAWGCYKCIGWGILFCVLVMSTGIDQRSMQLLKRLLQVFIISFWTHILHILIVPDLDCRVLRCLIP